MAKSQNALGMNFSATNSKSSSKSGKNEKNPLLSFNSSVNFVRAFCREISPRPGYRNGGVSPSFGSFRSWEGSKKWDRNMMVLATSKATSLVPHTWTFLTPSEKIQVRDYWLDLKPSERSLLVSADKNHILTLLTRHKTLSCGCQFCCRRRAIVEEEIIALYDTYALELESFSFSVGTSQSFNCKVQPTLSELFMTYEDVMDEELLTQESQFSINDEDDYIDEDDGVDSMEFNSSNPHLFRNKNFFPSDGPSRELAFRSALMSIAGDLLQGDVRRFIGLFEKLAERRIKFEQGPENPHRASPTNTIFTPIDLPNLSSGQDMSTLPNKKEKDLFCYSSEFDNIISVPGIASAATSALICHHTKYFDPSNIGQDKLFCSNEFVNCNEEYNDSEYDTESEEELNDIPPLKSCCHNSITSKKVSPNLSFEEDQIEEGRRIFQVIAAKAFEQRAIAAFKEVSAMSRLRALILEEQKEAADREARAQTQRLARQRKRQAKKNKKKTEKGNELELVFTSEEIPDETIATDVSKLASTINDTPESKVENTLDKFESNEKLSSSKARLNLPDEMVSISNPIIVENSNLICKTIAKNNNLTLVDMMVSCSNDPQPSCNLLYTNNLLFSSDDSKNSNQPSSISSEYHNSAMEHNQSALLTNGFFNHTSDLRKAFYTHPKKYSIEKDKSLKSLKDNERYSKPIIETPKTFKLASNVSISTSNASNSGCLMSLGKSNTLIDHHNESIESYQKSSKKEYLKNLTQPDRHSMDYLPVGIKNIYSQTSSKKELKSIHKGLKIDGKYMDNQSKENLALASHNGSPIYLTDPSISRADFSNFAPGSTRPLSTSKLSIDLQGNVIKDAIHFMLKTEKNKDTDPGNGTTCHNEIKSRLFNEEASLPSGHLDIDDILNWTPSHIISSLLDVNPRNGNSLDYKSDPFLNARGSSYLKYHNLSTPPPGFAPINYSQPNFKINKSEVISPPFSPRFL